MKRNSTMSLFAAMLLLTGSGCILMTGCQKDYDGQIEILRNQIEDGDVNVDNLLEKIELIEKQIVTLQEAAKEHAEFKESISKLIKDLETTKNELEGKIAELQKAMEENDQNIKNMIEQTVQEFDKNTAAGRYQLWTAQFTRSRQPASVCIFRPLSEGQVRGSLLLPLLR